MSTFDRCIDFVLRWEGGMTDDPNDPGGLTKYGIAQASHPGVDVLHLTRDQAAEIYERQYWGPAYCDVLEPSLALYTFDTAVNMGVNRAIRMLQVSCGAVPDGVFGPDTLEKSTTPPFNQIVQKFHDEREAHYRSLSGFTRFGKGWLSRNDDCLKTALEWLEGAKVA